MAAVMLTVVALVLTATAVFTPAANAVVDDLDGRYVLLPGYVVPLEFSDSRIIEFLLVPWVGACIHKPPPPANQIVHV